MINATKDFFYVSPVGTVHRGDDPPPPDGSTLLVAPGSQIQDDLAKKYGIHDKLGAAGKPKVARSTTGEPLVHRADGRAMAANVMPDDDEGKAAAMEAAEREQEERKDGKGEGEPAGTHDEPTDAADPPATKSLRLGDIEDKAVSPPASRKPAVRPSTRGK